ncbi:MAG: cytochrome c [Xanthomonadales bacterium]|jgi:mono/diheme cytochrome c family protein|nr:cytochrome c [Xanthomonadales bacterium]
MKKLLIIVVLVGVLAWWLSGPNGLDPDVVPAHSPDLANGERLFHAGGCASCHGRLEDGKPQRDVMAGGLVMNSPVGAFHVPNISPDPEQGIGAWSDLDFLNAMQRGLAPDGSHYYPAFPYTSYARMTASDLLDLKAYLDQLPADSNAVPDHGLGFPFNVRRGLGLWKRLFLDAAPVVTVPDGDDVLQRGRYLVEGPGHCGECHTPRNAAQALDLGRWLEGGPNPDGEGRVPGLTPARDAFADWSRDDIAYYLEAGVDPEFDVVGGTMAAVQANMSRLPAKDREAIAAYLKALQP